VFLRNSLRASVASYMVNLTVLSAAFGQNLSATVQTSVSLNQAETIALRQNREVLEASLEVSKSEASLKAVVASRYPQILAIAYVGQQISDGTPENVVALPGVFQPVTQQYRLSLQVQEATADVRIAQQRLRLAKQRTVADVKRLYLSMLALKSAIASLENNLGFLTELEQYIKHEAERGAALPVDLLLVQSRLAHLVYEVEKNKDDLVTKGQTLNRLLGRSPLTELVLSEEPNAAFVEMTEKATIAEALTNRPELSEVKQGIRKSGLERKVQLSHYIPDISVGVAGIYSRHINPPFPSSVTTVGFLGIWQPWDWGRRVELSKRSAREMRQEAIRLSDLTDTVMIDADKARRQIKVAAKELNAGQLAETSTQEQLRVVQKRFKVGAALLKDVLEAQADYTTAVAENVKAKSDFATAMVDVDESLGRDF
jgi:outer membrane protein